MGLTNFDVVVANQFVGGTSGAAPAVSPFAKVLYVDGTNGSDTNNGQAPDRAFATIAQAISSSVSSRGDHIVIAPGTYTVTSAIVPKANNVFRAAVVNPRFPTVTIVGDIADVVQIDVSGTFWLGIQFKAGGNTADNLVDIADAADVNGATFESCVFHGDDKTSVVGIQADDATFIPTGLIVRNCLFRDLTGTMIDIGVLGMPYSVIQYNTFAHDVNSGKGIALADTTAFATGKGYVIADNIFLPFDATGDEVGVSIAGTEDTTGAGIIARNLFSYGAAATSITQDKLSKSEVNNYTGDAATGGTLVDPGT
jgi:hypothetical protein